ncbi:tudor domain-containing protein 5-like isoform X3 [Phycodurus eques]|uniref:tudor domain-containing protein 5-like isoform X3 n=1 Tax=Phycodurus eques TaxID=693459 RepID=UPI002ACE1D76|nr:tudor domain-containing protein 5-like isoform X3 [Phycodurus eques]
MNQDGILVKLKKDVRSLLISSKVDLDPDLLRRDYKTMVGHPLPLKLLGFRNIMDMVKEMPEVVSVNVREDGSTFLKAVSHESTRNIEELVAKQRKSNIDKKRKNWQFSSYRNCHQSIPLVLPRRGDAPLALPPQLRAQLRILLSVGPMRLSELGASFLRCFGRTLRVHDFGFYSIGEMLEAAEDLVHIQQGMFGSILTLREQMLPRPFNTQQNLGAPKTTTKARVPTPTKSPDTTGRSVRKESTHVSCNLQVLDKNQEPEPQLCQKRQLFCQRFLNLQEEFQKQIVENGIAGTINHKLKEKLLKVVSQSSCGISVHLLPEEYKRLWGEDMPLKENGFVSVTELVDAMSDILQLQHTERDDRHDWIVKNIQGGVPLHSGDPGIKQSQTSCHTRESLWEVRMGDDGHILSADVVDVLTNNHLVKQERMSQLCPPIKMHCRAVVPLDALQNQHLERPTPHSALELVQVRVEHVESPGLFYTCFSGSEEAQIFEDMKVEMRLCYSSPDVSERYRLPKRFIRQGQVCCASSKDLLFTRGVIHKVIRSTAVEVYHVDLGMVTTIHTADLMFLKSCFSILPAQAVPSSLAGIKPTSGAWTSDAIASFVNLCYNHPLVGALFCYTGDVLQVYLCDTHTDKDIYIHCVLLSQGHGEACSPSASAALCVQVSPVSLYLGEGTFELPDVEEETTQSAETLEQSVFDTVRFEAEELPALEFIEDDEISTYIQNPSPTLIEEKLEFDGTDSCTVIPFPVQRTHEKIHNKFFQGANLREGTHLSWYSGSLLPQPNGLRIKERKGGM